MLGNGGFNVNDWTISDDDDDDDDDDDGNDDGIFTSDIKCSDYNKGTVLEIMWQPKKKFLNLKPTLNCCHSIKSNIPYL